MRTYHEFQLNMGFKEADDVFQYEIVSKKVRNQCILLLEELVLKVMDWSDIYWGAIERKIRFEFGLYHLTGGTSYHKVRNTFDILKNEEALYTIELMLEQLYEHAQMLKQRSDDVSKNDVQSIENAIDVINNKMKEDSLGYEFIEGKIIRVDNKFVHRNIVVDSIVLLREEEFDSASKEFFEAYHDYKNGSLKNAITNAGKSFESTMKIICDKLGYNYKQNDTASTLVRNLFDNEFIPISFKAHFTSTKNALFSGLPTIRNRHSHGDGMFVEEVTETMVQYALHLCATNIVFLVETYKAHKRMTDS